MAVAAIVTMLSACSAAPSTPTVPSLPQASGGPSADASRGTDANPNGTTGDATAARRTALHNAAECIRQHGAPRYQDPVLTANGQVYTDARTLQDSIEESALDDLEAACGELIRAARFAPDDQAPAPPKVVQAGVKVAECMRANGLPNVKDPTADSPFTPGHGFGHSPDELPGGKDDAFMRAGDACKDLINELNRLSSLGNLGDA
ncbi:hypothetical protein [Asanoa ferruginea]|uniref:hypothetical protein n=1 Tax=Asanoa ferruginea TaxID=53367 RepID=UPI0011C1B7A8|nr:hypothetical protein [Asanoa ferruginea]